MKTMKLPALLAALVAQAVVAVWSTSRAHPGKIYADEAWHLSSGGRKKLQQEPSISFLQQRKSRRVGAQDGAGLLVHYYSGFFGRVAPRELDEQECELPCALAPYPASDSVAQRADLLLAFPITAQPPQNARGAAALAFTMEASGRYGSENGVRYEGTANFSYLSTVPFPYFGLTNWRRIQGRARGPDREELLPSFEQRLPAAVFVARNCNGETRNLLIEELAARRVPIHSISDCAPAGTKQEWPEDVERSDKLGALRKYRVYLAFENTIEDSYVTEKAIDGFAAGAVPLYLGAPNAREYVPEDGFISANAAFEASGAARTRALDTLAKTIKQALNDKGAWQRYMAWQDQAIEKLNGGNLARRWSYTDGVDDYCRMCRYAYARLTPGSRWDHDKQQAVGGTPPPARGNITGWAAWRNTVKDT